MKFWKRAKYYLIGVGIGTVLVFIIFRGKGCSWLPENRVLDQIADSELLISDRTRCELKCHDISDLNVYELFSDRYGSVLFSESEQRNDPKMYVVESLDPKYKLEVVLKEDSVAVIDRLIIDSKKECACDSVSDEALYVFKIPEEKVKKRLFSMHIKIHPDAKCQMDCHGLTNNDIQKFIKSPTYLEDKSDPNASPNPTFVFRNFINKVAYRFYFEDADTRTRLVKIETEDKQCDCE